MADIKLALDLEGVLVTNAISQFPRPGLNSFLEKCALLFGEENICVFTTVDESRFRQVANQLVEKKCAPKWFGSVNYVDWVGEHKDLRFVCDDINSVLIVDDYPPYIKHTQKHRLIQIREYVDPYTHEPPNMTDNEFERVIELLKSFVC